jgi:hypothetical protein
MKDMLDDIPDDNLRRRLENFRDDPDSELWKRISSKLPSDEGSVAERLESYSDEPDESVWHSIRKHLEMQKFIDRTLAIGNLMAIASFLLLIFPVLQLNLRDATTNAAVETPLANVPGDSSSQLPNPASVSSEKLTKDEASLNLKTVAPADGLTRRSDSLLQDEAALKETTRHGVTVNRNLQDSVSSAFEKMKTPTAQNELDISGVSFLLQQKTMNGSLADSTRHSTTSVVATDFTETAAQHETDSSVERVIDQRKTVAAADRKIEKEEKQIRSGNYRIYSLVMPTFGYQQIKPVTTDDIFIHSIKKISAFSPKRLGVRVEAGVEKEISERVSLSAGLLYYQRKQTIAYEYTDAEQFTVVKSGGDSLHYKVEQPVLSSEFEYEVKNVGLTAGMAIGFRGKRFGQRVGVALEVHRSLSSSNAEQPGDARFYLFGNMYYRISYRISKRFDAIFQPTFNYAMQLDQRITAPFYVKPYGLGLNAGVYYYFR